jgi:VWFA-related protein
VVDVVVTDKQGQSVPGLRKDDFHLSEDSGPQIVTSFEEHKGAAPNEIKLPPMPPNVFTNFPTARGADSVNVLLLDLLNTQPQNQAFVRQQVIKYLGEVPPGTRLAVFALSSRLRTVRGFTTDFSGISATLEDKKLGIAPEVSRNLQTDANQYSDAEILRQMRKSQAAPSAIDAVESFQRDESAERANSRSELTLQAFQQIARYLSPIPARKNLIWFSDNFPVSFFPDTAAEFPRIRITFRKPRTCSPRQKSPSILCLRLEFSETPPSMPANWPVRAENSRLASALIKSPWKPLPRRPAAALFTARMR